MDTLRKALCNFLKGSSASQAVLCELDNQLVD